jgi:hypothetical protein
MRSFLKFGAAILTDIGATLVTCMRQAMPTRTCPKSGRFPEAVFDHSSCTGAIQPGAD